MLDSILNFLSEYEVGWTYLKIAIVLYIVCYVIEEVLGKYSRSRPSPALKLL